MSKLFKYEFRKSLFSKVIFVGITAVMELVYLIGIFGEKDNLIGIGMMGLVFVALAGITYIGIESILILYRDLTTKQSYMLFMTPNSSYKILGAKALQNAFSVLLSGLFFGGLAALDIWLLVRNQVGVVDILEMIRDLLYSIDPRIDLSAGPLMAFLLTMLCSWVLQIMTGYLAVVLSCTLLSGKKGAALIGFLFYLAISFATGWVSNKLPRPAEVVPLFLIQAAAALVWSVIMYFVTAWLMDKKLSV